ncbi:hypothetical protein POV27_19395 [Aureisphaera galaxeae]|uniref:hypothetical protein n=1 Tax=Aureisphaera galaxeae TaxID=1538023 RepID=UPI002350DB0A|nr:hypothetical protein [Aureisphaera galaxeae]MDC8006227.1 hypothetical protein [Aureisphaera galaxeae]
MVTIAPRDIIDEIIDNNYKELFSSKENVVYIASIPESLEKPNMERFFLEMGIWNEDRRSTTRRRLDLINYLPKETHEKILDTLRPPKTETSEYERIYSGELPLTKIEFVKPFNLQTDKKITGNYIRPAASGCQIAPVLNKAYQLGTFGGLLKLNHFYDQSPWGDFDEHDSWYIITNYHVINDKRTIQNSENGEVSKIRFYESQIYQPGLISRFQNPFIDSNGNLEYEYILKEDHNNLIGQVAFAEYNSFVDVAFIRVEHKNLVRGGNLWNNEPILKPETELIGGEERVKMRHGEEVTIYGRTSYEQKGKIRSTNAYVVFEPDSPNKKLFKKQILTEKISTNGDSGSLLLNNKNMAIGLLIGGDSETYSVCNNFDHIFGEKTFYKPYPKKLHLTLKDFINIKTY